MFVVTKLDLAEETRSPLSERLCGRGTNPWVCKLGVVALRNRTAKELDEELAPEQVRTREAQTAFVGAGLMMM